MSFLDVVIAVLVALVIFVAVVLLVSQLLNLVLIAVAGVHWLGTRLMDRITGMDQLERNDRERQEREDLAPWK